MFSGLGSPMGAGVRMGGGVREPLNRNTANDRSWNPMNNIRANRFSHMSAPASLPSRTRTYTSAPSSTTYVYPSSRPSTVFVGSPPSTFVYTSSKWFGVALAILGVSLAILGAAVLAPELIIGGAATALVGGIIYGVSRF